MRRRVLGGATFKPISGETPILNQLQMIEAVLEMSRMIDSGDVQISISDRGVRVIAITSGNAENDASSEVVDASDCADLAAAWKVDYQYEQAGDPAYREECRRVFGEIWADVIRRMTTPEINSGEA